MTRLRIAAFMAIPALVAGMASVSWGQPGATVGVQPVGTRPEGPHQGGWWFSTITPGGPSVKFEARLTNGESADRTVRLYLSEYDFLDDGTPVLAERPKDVGTWGSVEKPEVSVPAKRSIVVSFTVAAPAGAEPGDHVGAFVAENLPDRGSGQAVGQILRVATRFYLTVPGDARAAVSVEKVIVRPDSILFPRRVVVIASVRNTGRVRLDAAVSVAGRRAAGATTLLSQSAEDYRVQRPVPLWGGRVREQVRVTTRRLTGPGPSSSATASAFLFPWHLLGALLLVLGLATVAASRKRRYQRLRQDVARLERQLSEREADAGRPPRRGPAPD
ncbi:MAG TPA: hypothetical protein VNE62_12650 [Actinomycetota bacterium]|nr:hypothetical protein [Actinomycetota bacterium]